MLVLGSQTARRSALVVRYDRIPQKSTSQNRGYPLFDENDANLLVCLKMDKKCLEKESKWGLEKGSPPVKSKYGSIRKHGSPYGTSHICPYLASRPYLAVHMSPPCDTSGGSCAASSGGSSGGSSLWTTLPRTPRLPFRLPSRIDDSCLLVSSFYVISLNHSS